VGGGGVAKARKKVPMLNRRGKIKVKHKAKFVLPA